MDSAPRFGLGNPVKTALISPYLSVFEYSYNFRSIISILMSSLATLLGTWLDLWQVDALNWSHLF